MSFAQLQQQVAMTRFNSPVGNVEKMNCITIHSKNATDQFSLKIVSLQITISKPLLNVSFAQVQQQVATTRTLSHVRHVWKDKSLTLLHKNATYQ